MVKAETAKDWEYEVEDAARTLIKAQQIKTDKKLYAAALKELQKQRDALNQELGGNK